VLRTFDGAGGDFCAVTRGTYARLGGYLLVHGNRGVDREFTERARTHGVAVIQEYEHYHVTHDNAIVEAPGRSLDVIEAAPVEPELVDEVWRLVDGANGD